MKSKMRLMKFRVRGFRSVEDSGMIEVDDVGSFIGINESGKSNLLIPLWKLNPATGGEIHPLTDMPRSKYNVMRDLEKKPVFIDAYFALADDLAETIAGITGVTVEAVKTVKVSRDFGGTRYITFPNANPVRHVKNSEVRSVLSKARSEIDAMGASGNAEADVIRPAMLAAIDTALAALKKLEADVAEPELDALAETLKSVALADIGENSTIGPRFGQLTDAFASLKSKVSLPHPHENENARKEVMKHLPKFVYYSNYGNLDSEIYLPHVIENMSRKDLGSKEQSKARTLKVLFDFVGLKPKEILELGKEEPNLNKEQLEKVAERKRERDVLMQSASTRLTKEFRAWWKQGDYRFRFQADGNHFRIWVSDDKRPEDIELEGRSTGLQWFLSFFLVFLVEAQDAHEGAILLLDEPGLTLHPLAQKDLSTFFDNLADTNQLIFSTHSPFMVESDKLDRVRAVYLDNNGRTVVSADLRSAAPHSVQAKSIYAAHAALGLTVSDALLQGCQPVIVEGVSDQIYLSALKTYLIGKGQIRPNREIVFVPTGGTRGIKAVAAVLASKEDELPFVILDSDEMGKKMAQNLRAELYSAQKDRVILIGDVLGTTDAVEVEDLLPKQLVAETFSREYHGKDEEFSDSFDEAKPIVPQMEAFARTNDLTVEDGWKVDLARAVKRRTLGSPALLDRATDKLASWTLLFKHFGGQGEAPPPRGTKAQALSKQAPEATA